MNCQMDEDKTDCLLLLCMAPPPLGHSGEKILLPLLGLAQDIVP